MKTKTLWRWQETLRLSAYAKLLNLNDLFVIAIMIIDVIVFKHLYEISYASCIFFAVLMLFMLYMELITLCCAEDCFTIKRDKKDYNVYVLQRHGYTLLELVECQSKKSTFLEVDYYDAKLLAAENNFIFRPKGQKDWYLNDAHSAIVFCLGKRLKATVFSDRLGRLNVLDNGSVKRIFAKTVYFHTDSYFLMDSPKNQEEQLSKVDDCFVVENEDKYEVYGVVLNKDDQNKPAFCIPVIAEVIAARNETEAIALAYIKDKYVKLASRSNIEPLVDEKISVQ